MENSDNEVDLLPLWSWQTPDFSLIRGTVDHGRSIFKKEHSGFEKSCKELSERLEIDDDQFIWCFTYPKEQWQGRERWELEVPKHRVLAYTCNVAWHWILAHNGNDDVPCNIPLKFERIWFKIANTKRNECKKKFTDDWRKKTTEQLWNVLFLDDDALFLDKVYGDCTDVLLRHPVEDKWVKHPRADPKQ